MLLFNSRLRLFPGKLKSKWSGAFKVIEVFPHGGVELEGADGQRFKVNGQQVKTYREGEPLVTTSVFLDEPKA